MQSFIFFLRTSSEISQQSFFPLLFLSTNSICPKPNQNYLIMLQSYSIDCSLANLDTKDPIVTMRLLTVFQQPNPKSVFTYSLGHQNNTATKLSRALPWRYVADFEHIRTRYNLHITINIFKWSHMAEVVTYSLSRTRFI